MGNRLLFYIDKGVIQDLTGLNPNTGGVGGMANIELVDDEYGRVNKSIRFNGTSSFIRTLDNRLLQFVDAVSDKPFTIVSKLKRNAGGPICAKYAFGSTSQYRFRVRTDGKVDLTLFAQPDNNVFRQAITDITIPNNTSVIVAASYDGRGGSNANQGVRIKINNVTSNLTLIGTGTYTKMNTNNSEFSIGVNRRTTTFTEWFAGDITSLMVWGGVLTDEEETACYNKLRA